MAALSEAGLPCQLVGDDDWPLSMLMSVKAGADILASMHSALTRRLSLACRWPLISDQYTQSGGRRSGAPEQVPCWAARRLRHDAFSPPSGPSAALPAIWPPGLSWPSGLSRPPGLARLLASGAQPRPILVRPIFWHNHGPLNQFSTCMHLTCVFSGSVSRQTSATKIALLAILAHMTAETHALIGVTSIRL